jgi:predicted metal-dependent hydrolase
MPFHAHEVFEDAWKTGPADEHDLWKGLAQLAVGLTHAARGNLTGSATLLRRGADYIEPFADAAPHGLDVTGLRTWALALAEDVDAGTEIADPAASAPRLRSGR